MADLATQAELETFFGAGWHPRMKKIDTFFFLDSLALPFPPAGWKWRLVSTPTHDQLLSEHPEAAALAVGCGTYLVLERAVPRTDLRPPNHPRLPEDVPANGQAEASGRDNGADRPLYRRP